jgi:hypothetical protein
MMNNLLGHEWLLGFARHYFYKGGCPKGCFAKPA